MAYVDFTYYQATFGGSSIPEADFISYERKARRNLDYFTFDRIKNDNTLITDDVKECLCEMMELNYKLDQEEIETDGKIISSETVGNTTTSYAVSDIEKNAVDKSQINKVKYYNIAKEYLSNTGLLYRGV